MNNEQRFGLYVWTAGGWNYVGARRSALAARNWRSDCFKRRSIVGITVSDGEHPAVLPAGAQIYLEPGQSDPTVQPEPS